MRLGRALVKLRRSGFREDMEPHSHVVCSIGLTWIFWISSGPNWGGGLLKMGFSNFSGEDNGQSLHTRSPVGSEWCIGLVRQSLMVYRMCFG